MDPLDEIFWNEQKEKLYNVLYAVISVATVNAAKRAFDELSAIATLGIGWDVVNEEALAWAATHTEAVVAKITETSMKAFIKEFEPWVQSGEPTSVLIEKLIPYYGEARAEMIAVTEITRAYARGNINFWKSTGLVSGFNWMTAEDDAVCPICNGKEAENPHGIDADSPPAHVLCRCFLTPVLANSWQCRLILSPTSPHSTHKDAIPQPYTIYPIIRTRRATRLTKVFTKG